MPRLIAMMIIRNEADRYLKRTLEELVSYTDEVVIIDDNSTDESREICRSFEQVHLVTNNRSTFWIDESSLRRQCWEKTVAREPDWILALDADEMLEESIKWKVEELMEEDKYDRIAFRLFEFWNSFHSYRVDKMWNPKNRWVVNMIRYFPSYPYRWRKQRLHCGRLPANLPGRTYYSDLRLKHYGYVRPEDQRRKYYSYLLHDPEGEHCPLSHYQSIMDPDPVLEEWEEAGEEREKEKGDRENKEVFFKGDNNFSGELVDLVIVSYNNRDSIARLLESIREHTRLNHRIIVVDNSSTDGTLEYLQKQKDISLLALDQNLGYGAAANRGIKQGQSKYIMVMNSDLILTPGWLEPLIACLRSPRVAVVGPRMITPEGQLAGAGVIGTESCNHLRGFLKTDHPALFQERENCVSVSGACYGIKRSLLPILGYFDEDFFLYFEETDYSFRARDKGYSVVYCPESCIYHDLRWEERNHRELYRHYCLSRQIFEKKWSHKLERRRYYQRKYRQVFRG